MIKMRTDDSWEDYLYWKKEEKKSLKQINQIIRDIVRNGQEGKGKPEPSSGNLT